ncbi:MAG: hypothetical protein JST89_13650 [Cyanobacteria bacterium SZAS-4]|nr:hypothetical protein [Cyanobacteria bacterium SZAS-4]
MANFLQRYEAGEHNVWNEMVCSAPEIFKNEELMTEATAVARAIMKRVQLNASAVRQTLKNARANPGPGAAPQTDEDLSIFTKRFGPLPLSLDVFYRTVGSIELTPVDYDYGDNELESRYGIELITLDPLLIEPANSLGWMVDDYDAQIAEDEEADNPLQFGLCPDFLHKADISGGTPYFVDIPAFSAEDKLDPLVNFDDMDPMPLVEYFRYCFRWGGFPGLAVMELEDREIDLNRKMPFTNAKGDWRKAAQGLLAELRTGLIAF